MKRRTDTISPLIEKICKRTKTFTKHSLMLKLSKLLPDITDDEVRNTINILMQRGTIERDYNQKKGDSKGAVYKVVDKKIIEALRKADEIIDAARTRLIFMIKNSFNIVDAMGLNDAVIVSVKQVTGSEYTL